MGAAVPSPVFGLVFALTVGVIILTIFAWRWAIRHPMTIDTTPNNPIDSPLVFAAVGASDVVGVGARDPETQSWANVVHRRMPPDTVLVRLGRSGITLREANSIEVPRAVQAQPDIVTVWNCVNDAVQQVPIDAYRRELNKALSALTKHTQANVLVMNMPDLSLVLDNMIPPSQRELIRGGIIQWNRAIEETTRPFGDRVRVLDLFDLTREVLQHPEYLSMDHFHPSTEGYRRIGELVWETIERAGLLPGQGGDYGREAEAS